MNSVEDCSRILRAKQQEIDGQNDSRGSSRSQKSDRDEEEDKELKRVREKFFGFDLPKIDNLRQEQKRPKEKSEEEKIELAKLDYHCKMPPPSYKFSTYIDYDVQGVIPAEYFYLNVRGHKVRYL